MTNFAKPVAQRPQNWLAQLRGLAAANAAGGTAYTVEYPKRKAGDTTPESERGVSVAITGNVETDHEGAPTGLTGWGQAVKNTSTGNWEKVGEDSGWITPTLENSYASHAGIIVQYRRVNSVVRLRGSFTKAGVSGKPAFTLPEGFRPTQQEIYTLGAYPSGTSAVNIETNGQVIVTGTLPEYGSLSGMTFTTD